jgi:hypothetical protein
VNGKPRLKKGSQRVPVASSPSVSGGKRKLSNSVGGSKSWGLLTMAKSDATHHAPRLRRKILPPH